MKQGNTSKVILTIAYFLSAMVIIAVLVLILLQVIGAGKAETAASASGPDYAVSQLRWWSTTEIPPADAFLNDNAKYMVKSAGYAVLPQAHEGDQTVALLLRMEDGTVRTENAILSAREPVVHLELGDTEATPYSLLGDEYKDATFSQPVTDFNAVGSYPISVVNADGSALPFTMIVEDTTAPVVELRSPAQFSVHQEVTPQDFVVSCKDASPVTFSFNSEPDTSQEGTNTASILATDAQGNSHTYEAVYTVAGDGAAPEITGVADMRTLVKMPVNYLRGVSAVDETDGELQVLVTEPEGFDIKTAGDYTITFTAQDSAGNITTKTATLKVLPNLDEVDTLTEEDVYRIGDAIVATLWDHDDPTITEAKKARKLYRYAQDHMMYKDNKDIKPWHTAAAIAMYRNYGDCRNYYAFAKLMYDCGGFENMQVARVCSSDKESKHFWNLVKIDGSWYHCDTTPRVGRSDFFMLTDAQLDAYNATQSDKPFNRDKSLYPATP